MVDSSQFAFPKPGDKSGRLVLKRAGYRKLKQEKWEQQAHCCAQCGKYLTDPGEAHLHHIHGRGLGGGKRDDRKTTLLCPSCHQKVKIVREEQG